VNLRDATLIFLAESAEHPAVAGLAQDAYDRMIEGEDVDYRVLSELIGEASGKGVLRALNRKYSPAAYEAIIGPILSEIGQRAPIKADIPTWEPGEDPLTANVRPRFSRQ
jgi:hypothetical protein